MRHNVPPNRIKELRERSNMQQKELALAVGVTRPTISEWENNKKNPTSDRLEKLEEIFGLPKSVILGYEEIPTPIPVLFVDSGQENANREIENARILIQRDPERKTLFDMATKADIKVIRRAIAVLDALQGVEE